MEDRYQRLLRNPQVASLLAANHFDHISFESLRAALKRGTCNASPIALQSFLQPPTLQDITPWPTQQHTTKAPQTANATDAIAHGSIGVVVLNGGMATRFGGVVKGTMEIASGVSFLGYRLRQIAEQGRSVHVFLMNSFATETATAEHLDANHYFGFQKEQCHLFKQNISLRLTPDGSLFLDANGQVSPYAPGHGDLCEALKRCAAFQRFVRNGGRWLQVVNVDNLAASLDARVIDAHIASGCPLTVEVANRYAGDVGGAPLWVNGHLQIVEDFRMPKSFDRSQLTVFNTNSMVMDVSVIQSNLPLTWTRADKKIEGRPVVQFERLMGEISAHINTHLLHVPRGGKESRFEPIKTPEDLHSVRQRRAPPFIN